MLRNPSPRLSDTTTIAVTLPVTCPRVTEIERRSCPRFTDVYVRDLYGQVSHEDHQRTMCIRWQLQAYHPCKNVISHMCQRKFVEATARVA